MPRLHGSCTSRADRVVSINSIGAAREETGAVKHRRKAATIDQPPALLCLAKTDRNAADRQPHGRVEKDVFRGLTAPRRSLHATS